MGYILSCIHNSILNSSLPSNTTNINLHHQGWVNCALYRPTSKRVDFWSTYYTQRWENLSITDQYITSWQNYNSSSNDSDQITNHVVHLIENSLPRRAFTAQFTHHLVYNQFTAQFTVKRPLKRYRINYVRRYAVVLCVVNYEETALAEGRWRRKIVERVVSRARDRWAHNLIIHLNATE